MFLFEEASEVDLDEIQSILTSPHVWPYITDDYSGSPRDFKVTLGGVQYIKILRESKCLGCFILIKHSENMVDFHTCTLPACRGFGSEILKEFTQWVFENTKFTRIIGNAPEINRLALKMAFDSGFKEWGRNPKSFMKNGKLVDLIWVGIDKEF